MNKSIYIYVYLPGGTPYPGAAATRRSGRSGWRVPQGSRTLAAGWGLGTAEGGEGAIQRLCLCLYLAPP